MALPFTGALSKLVGSTGKALGLPELGISEAISDPNRSVFTANGNNLNTLTNSPLASNRNAISGGNQLGSGDTGSVLGASDDLTGLYTAQQQAQAAQAAQSTAEADNLINASLGQLEGQQRVGQQNISSSYQSALQGLLNGKAQTLGNYANQRNQNQQDNIAAQDQINSSVRNQNQSLSRLLGSRGAGNSSAATILAPYAAGLQGNIQRSQVNNTFAKNQGALDSAESDYLTQFGNSVGGLDAQRRAQENQLAQGVAQNRASLLSSRSDAGRNVGQIQGILSNATQLGVTPTFTPAAVSAKTPDLSQYNYDAAQAAQLGDGTAATQNAGIYGSLLGEDRKRLLGV